MDIYELTYRLRSGVAHAGMFYVFFYIVAFLSFIPVIGSLIFLMLQCNPFRLISSAFNYKLSIDAPYIIIGLVWGIKYPIDIAPFRTMLRIGSRRFFITLGVLTLAGASLVILFSILAAII